MLELGASGDIFTLDARVGFDEGLGSALLWILAGRAEGEALAAAGVNLDLQFDVDLFDRMGFSAR
jgi:hypothetical protein